MDGYNSRRCRQSKSADGWPVCFEKNTKFGLLSARGGRASNSPGITAIGRDMSSPGTDPQVTLNVVAFTVAFPTPELGWRTSKMVGPINPGELNWSLDRKGSTGAAPVSE